MVLLDSRLRTCAFALLAGLLALPAVASAAPRGGGLSPGTPVVEAARCGKGPAWQCRPGQKLTIRGQDLGDVRAVAFMGRRDAGDDRHARPRRVRERSFVVSVPRGARSGPLRIRSSAVVTRTERSVRLQTAVMSSAGEMTFPIRGKHDMGKTETNHFGGGRGHQGHDLFADCGTSMVAVVSATVQQVAYHSRAGHYVVLQDRRGRSYAYMHLRVPSPLEAGESVSVGQVVGEMGDTGRATGCHLHFEQWTSPGWRTGGRPVDPLPLLEKLEAAPHPH